MDSRREESRLDDRVVRRDDDRRRSHGALLGPQAYGPSPVISSTPERSTIVPPDSRTAPASPRR